MTALTLRHWRRDGPLALLLAATLVAVGGFVSRAGLRDPTAPSQGWRRIDTAAVQQRISSGDLQDREALWYHAIPPEAAGIGRP